MRFLCKVQGSSLCSVEQEQEKGKSRQPIISHMQSHQLSVPKHTTDEGAIVRLKNGSGEVVKGSRPT